ncbi:unnamed protein product, partial [marine sediment metagenome]
DKRFPDEFNWNYENLVKFYDKSIIEKPTVYTIQSDKPNIQKNQESKSLPWEERSESGGGTVFAATGETGPKQDPVKVVKFNLLLKNLDKELISENDFIDFVTNVILWDNIKTLNDFTLDQLNILLENWQEKIIPRYREAKKTPAKLLDEGLSDLREKSKEKEKKEKTPLDLLQKKLRENNIFHKDFRRFIREVVGWKNIKFISNLSGKELDTLLNNWDEKILPKYMDFVNINAAKEQSENRKESEESKQKPVEESKEY